MKIKNGIILENEKVYNKLSVSIFSKSRMVLISSS